MIAQPLRELKRMFPGTVAAFAEKHAGSHDRDPVPVEFTTRSRSIMRVLGVVVESLLFDRTD